MDVGIIEVEKPQN